MKSVVKAEDNHLVYYLDSTTPLKLMFHLVYCSPEITETLNKDQWYVDASNHIIVCPHVTIDMTDPNAPNNGKYQFINGFISGINYLPYILHFQSEEDKSVYVKRLISTLANLTHYVASLGRPYGIESYEIIRKVNVQVLE